MAVRKKISKMRLNDHDKLKSDFAKMHIDTFTRNAVEDIKKIKARIHRVILFCPRDERPQGKLYDYFKRKFNDAGIISDPVSRKRMKGYKNQLVVTNNVCKIYIFINRFAGDFTGLLPAFRMEIIPKEETSASEFNMHLAELNKLVANLHPSEVEYTLDLFCEQPREVENLFLLASRSLYVPYKNNPRLFNNYPEISDEVDKRVNSTFYASDNLKIYERGDDDKKEEYVHKSGKTKKGWYYKNINRLRLENTANRTTLDNHKIYTLSDLIDNCKFHELNKNLYKFKSFMSKNLPNYWRWPSYSTENNLGHKGAFQIEYVFKKLLQTNLRQYMKDVEEFDVLKERLTQHMLDFDSSWGQRLNY